MKRRTHDHALRVARLLTVTVVAAALVSTAVFPVGCGNGQAVEAAASPAVAAPSSPSMGRASPSIGPRPASGSKEISLSAADAAAVFSAFNRAFYRGTPASGYYRQSTGGSYADFWREAEMLETAEDYFQLSHGPAYERLVEALCRGFLARYGSDWLQLYSFPLHRASKQARANDDVMWMVIASARAYEISGDAALRRMAKRNFDRAYARSISSDFGGGLWWRSARDRPLKNTTTNGPAVIAALELYRTLNDRSYLAKGVGLYRWMRTTLYDASSGQVYDGVGWAPKHAAAVVSRARYTYNQGTFIGAAAMLYEATHDRTYYMDAVRALQYTRVHLTRGAILQNDANSAGRDAGGFKGIFARWAIKFTADNGIPAFDAWLRLNAATALSHRNRAGLVSYEWTASTSNGPQWSWDCSSAVAMAEALLPGSTR